MRPPKKFRRFVKCCLRDYRTSGMRAYFREIWQNGRGERSIEVFHKFKPTRRNLESRFSHGP